MSNFFKVILKGLSTRDEELVSHLCFEHGASGVSEDLEFDQSDDAFNVKTLQTDKHSICAYFEQKPSEDLFLKLQSEFPGVEIEVRTEENKDWLAEWKKGFHAFELCEGHWVVPSWEEPPKDKKIIKIDPGMAFGTGTHETTQLVARLLAELQIESSPVVEAQTEKKPVVEAQTEKTPVAQEHTGLLTENNSLLDVGTGTGIIAMLAHHLGFEYIAATEIDETARRVARENFDLNKMTIHLPDYQVEQLEKPFDVVVANIIDGVLVDIQSDLYRMVKSGGYLILSGIMQERDERFKENFQAFKLYDTIRRDTHGEWVGYVIQIHHA